MAENEWSNRLTVEQMYGDWDWEAAVAAVDRSLDPRPSSSIFDTIEVLGSEWYEASQEAEKAPNYLLQVSRLRRARDSLIAEIGEVAYRVVYGNALWGINQMLGKLESRIYVLRRTWA